MRKLILKCGLAAGDIVMLTAAVRDLHRCYPGQFQTDVRTACPDLWLHNPHLTPLADEDPEVEHLDCSYPLINRCNETPYHCLHGFIDFLNGRLRLAITPTAFHGDLHLSPQEQAWYSQVHELTGQDTPFWLVAAGGKYDLTIKWWQTERYQQVLDHFQGRIQFVQVGETGHHHPRLEGAIDLRGKTSLRELVRLVYHSQGVLCAVTGLMHLAAAVQTRRGRPPNRPCVVLAGGREPAHWEAYPSHQFIHTTGALRCCLNGGCWRDRTARLRDGDPRDRPDHLCLDVRHGLPHCMDLITPAEVIRRIGLYFQGGVLHYLSGRQRKAATKGVRATARNPYDRQRLNRHSASLACERFIRTLPAYPDDYQGRGIVLCGDGAAGLARARACADALRRRGCGLPIQFWHPGRAEADDRMKPLLTPLGVECVDALRVRRRFPVRGWPGLDLKPFALLHSPFREVLLLEARTVPVANLEHLFDSPQFQASGALFWPRRHRAPKPQAGGPWRSCGLCRPAGPGFDPGRMLVDKSRCWPALRLALWFHEHADFYFAHRPDAQDACQLAFRKLKVKHCLARPPNSGRTRQDSGKRHTFRSSSWGLGNLLFSTQPTHAAWLGPERHDAGNGPRLWCEGDIPIG